jgi:TPP-dependent pyruvate/acetoin dehydrogenase alpha subunit
MLGNQFSLDEVILSKAYEILEIEKQILYLQENDQLNIPVYLGIGQEFIAATISAHFKSFQPAIFAQHRAHSYFVAFGGDTDSLIAEVLGDVKNGCAKGYGGSVGIYSKEIGMFGHTGLMGEQVYLGTGWAYATRKPTIVVMGDATIEEDYVAPALGFAAMQELPVIFVCEDNGLAVLTPTEKRRKWRSADLAIACGIESFDINDDPKAMSQIFENFDFKKPIFMNIHTRRKNRHVGAQLEGKPEWDRLLLFESYFRNEYGSDRLNQIREKCRYVE